ncbi:hypothetical protein M493_10365 [Geobacillus genomosp. 3]|uniref:Uncharacterized protein n=1 Tax=Geobacillus genomosp. 3 TaxID=1921421 RepID=S5Z071_GEOG3|nr:hypothetical protein M493_10365 [Geobacillus genomosp. 3]
MGECPPLKCFMIRYNRSMKSRKGQSFTSRAFVSPLLQTKFSVYADNMVYL